MQNLKEFYEKFLKIKEIGWIESINDSYCSVGKTFEKLMGIENNSLEIPDYNGIEIKTKNGYVHLYTTLFNCKPDGPYYMETERLKDTYGYPDKTYSDYNVLNNCVFCNRFTKINDNTLFKLRIDRNQKKLFLEIYDNNFNLLEKTTYWDFDSLEEKLFRKLKILAYIHCSKKYSKGKIYYKYTNINFYKLKTFNDFIDLLEKGIIRVTFKVGIHKKGNKFGKTYDHGTGFDIKEEDLLQLYDNISISQFW